MQGHVFLPGLFCRRAFYLTGCTVLISQTAPCKQSYTLPHWTPIRPFLNMAKCPSKCIATYKKTHSSYFV